MASVQECSSRESFISKKRYSSASTTIIPDCLYNSSCDLVKRCNVSLRRLPNHWVAAYYKNIRLHRKKLRKSKEYAVRKIVAAFSTKRGEVKYQVTWWGWKKCTFESECNLTNSYTALREFYERQSDKGPQNEIDKVLQEFSNNIHEKQLVGMNVSYYLDIHSYSFSCLYVENLSSFKQKILNDLDSISRCVASINAYGLPNDDALQKRGVVLATILEIISRREQQLLSLAKSERLLNTMEVTKLYIENNVDLVEFPTNFSYIPEMIIGEGVEVYEEPLLHCTCYDCDIKSNCCGKLNDSEMMYLRSGRLKTLQKIPIFECNKKCPCPGTCRNRVVQNGRKVELIIFKTAFRGWGVKAKKRIPRGTFICEHIGELISVKAKGRSLGPYVFALDFDSSVPSYCVDATAYGNVGRFINHGCQPNAQVNGVWVNNPSRDMERLAIFSNTDIKPGEEILIDYMGGKAEAPSPTNTSRCYCGAEICRMLLLNE